eukprot:Gb_26654 [translate_table: standard]
MGRIATADSQCLTTSKSAVGGKARAGTNVKKVDFLPCHSETKGKVMVEKLSMKGGGVVKESPIGVISACNLCDSHLKTSCDNVTPKIGHANNASSHKAWNEDSVEVRKECVYQSTPKTLQDRRVFNSRSNLKVDVDMGLSNCDLKPQVHDKENISMEADNALVPDKSYQQYSSSLIKDQEVEFELEKISKSSHFLNNSGRRETFDDRALHFGEEDWSSLERWRNNQGGAEVGRSFHSSSGSDTSSSLSTLELSSFSCRSEADSFARSELSSNHVSTFTPSFMSQSSSPNRASQKQSISTDALRHGSEHVSKRHPQIKGDIESQLSECLEFKVPEQKMERNHSRAGEIKENTYLSSSTEILTSINTTLKYCHSSLRGVDIGNGDHGQQNEMGSSSSFDLSTKQLVSGFDTPDIFQAEVFSPEICSEIQVSEDVAPQSTINKGYSTVTQSYQAGTSEDDVNVQLEDDYDHLAVTITDGSYTQVCDPVLQAKSTASAYGPLMQIEASDISMTSGTCQTPLHLDDNRSGGETSPVSLEDNQKSPSSRSLKFTVHEQISNGQGLALNSQTCSNEITFLRPQFVLDNGIGCGEKFVDIPSKSAAACTGQLPCATLDAKGALICDSRTHGMRRTKSFQGCPDPPIQSTESSSVTDGPKVCGEVIVSPIRRRRNPLINSREKPLIDVSSCAPFINPLLHPLNDAKGILSPGKWARMEKPQRKSLVWAFPGTTHITSKAFSKGLMMSQNQLFVAAKLGIPHKQLLPISKKSIGPVLPKHEQISKKQSIYIPETKDVHPKTSASLARPPISQGLLHYVYKNGLPYYTFSLNKSEEFLVAKTWKINNCGREGFDWLYTFYSVRNNEEKRNKIGWTRWGRKDKNACDLVGHMKVSSSLCPKFNSSGILEDSLETEFVLFAANVKHAKESLQLQTGLMEKNTIGADQLALRIPPSNGYFADPLSTSITSSTHMSGYFAESLNPRYVASPKHANKEKVIHELKLSNGQSSHGSCQSSPLKSKFVDGNADFQEIWSDAGILVTEICHSDPFPSHLELAAIVIRLPFSQGRNIKGRPCEGTVSKAIGGWGLKFLQKSSESSGSKNTNDLQEKSPPSETVENTQIDSQKTDYGDISVTDSVQSSGRYTFDHQSVQGDSLSCRKQQVQSVTVILAADIHGLPTIESSGPSPLIDRWKFGGRCDCGGWDLGCTLTVLSNGKHDESELIEPNKKTGEYHSVDVFSQGAKQDTPALRMAAVHDGLHVLSYRSQLSTLQAFSIGVAMLHSRDPFMQTKVEGYPTESCSRSLQNPFDKQGRNLNRVISAIPEEIHTDFHRADEGFSTSYVSDPPLSPLGRA